MHPRKQHVLDVFGREPETLDELAYCTIKVIESVKADRWGHSKTTETCNVVGFSWDIRDSMVSNSHSAPLDGVSNWGGKDGLPTVYPGWTGRVWIRYDNTGLSPGSEPFNAALSYPGTGGVGGYNGPWEAVSVARWKRHGYSKTKKTYPKINCYSWNYKIFLSDWPGLQTGIEQQRIVDKLAGVVTRAGIQHRFLWEDPITKAADAAFIAECAIAKAAA
jgi:hypothetical protein